MQLGTHSRFALLAAIAGLIATHAYSGAAPEPPRLQDVLAAKGGKVIVFQPTQIKTDQTLVLTHTQFRRSTAPRGFQRAFQFVIYSTKPDVSGEYPVLFRAESLPEAELGAEPGGGPHVTVFNGYTHPVVLERQGVIAVLIGWLMPSSGTGTPRMTPLPALDSFTLELNGEGIALLLPAVQKVREAAAR